MRSGCSGVNGGVGWERDGAAARRLRAGRRDKRVKEAEWMGGRRGGGDGIRR